jgi:hypothetical protein
MGLSDTVFGATNIKAGLAEDEPVQCKAGDLYLQTDTEQLRACFESGVFKDVKPTLTTLVQDLIDTLGGECGLTVKTYDGTTGTDIYQAHDATKSYATSAWAKQKEITLGFTPKEDSMKITWKIYNGDSGEYFRSAVYLNGVALTGEDDFRQGTSTGYKTCEYTITGQNLKAGDTIEIWAKAGGTGGNTSLFRIIGDVTTITNLTENTV